MFFSEEKNQKTFTFRCPPVGLANPAGGICKG